MFSRRFLLPIFTLAIIACSALQGAAAASGAAAAPATVTAPMSDRLFAALANGGQLSWQQRYDALEARIGFLNSKIKEGYFGKEGSDGEREAQEALKKAQAAERAMLLGGSRTGEVIAKGFAGDKNAKALDDVIISSVWDGIITGLQMNLAGSVGSFASTEVSKALNTVGGGLLPQMVKKVTQAFKDMNSTLFHGGKKPFEQRKVHGWGETVWESLGNIDAMVSNANAFGMRGLDQASRQFEDDGKVKEEEDVAWQSCVDIYVDQFEYIIEKIEESKEYYDEDDFIVACSDKIVQILSFINNLLKESKTFRKFSETISTNKQIIKAMQSLINKVFLQLSAEVKERDGGSLTELLSSSGQSGMGSSAYRGVDNGGGFPGSYSSGAPGWN